MTRVGALFFYKPLGLLIVFGSILSLASCLGFDQAYVTARQNELRQLLQDNNSKNLLDKVSDRSWANGLREIAPGAAYSIGLKLQEMQALDQAHMMFEQQLQNNEPDWQALAFLSWLRLSAQAQPAQIVASSKEFFLTLDTESRYFAEARLLFFRTVIAAQISLEDWLGLESTVDQAINSIQVQVASGSQANALLSLASDTIPDWLIYAKIRLLLKGNHPEQAQYAAHYVLFFDPQKDQLNLQNQLLAQGLIAQEGGQWPHAQILANLFQIKRLVLEQKPLQAWELAKLVLSQKSQLIGLLKWFAGDRQGLDSVFGKSFSRPEALFRDFYQAARLAGRFSEGIDLFEDLASSVWQASLLGTANFQKLGGDLMRSYLYEIQGRLHRFKNDHRAAALSFGVALELSYQLEKDQHISPSDRRRQQWYQLRSLTDLSQEPGTVLFDSQEIIKIVRQTDDFEYFADVFERILLILGQRREWADLLTIYQACSDYMDETTRFRYQIVLIRAQNLSQAAAPKNEILKTKWLKELHRQRRSLYYYALAAHELEEPIDLAQFIDENPGKIIDQADSLETSALGLEPVAKTLLVLGLYKQASTFVWDNRRQLSSQFQLGISRELAATGLYRDAIRLADSLRLRFGLPQRQESLMIFYPRPHRREFDLALIESPQPWWLFTSLVRTESAFDSIAKSGPGAEGLAQLMPATATELAQRLKIDQSEIGLPSNNLRMGARYLSEQWQRFSNWAMALAAYNAGRGRVSSWRTSGFTDDSAVFVEIMPFAETRNYVRRVFENSLIYAWLYDGQSGDVTLKQLLFNSKL